MEIINLRLSTIIIHITIILSCFGYAQSQNYNPVNMINKAFDKYPIVALGEGMHESPEIYSLFSQLLNNIEFVEKVDVIVFEVANSKHQELLDRYVFGENISIQKLSVVWRDATNSGAQTGDSPLYVDFFKLIRSVNKKLPQKQKIRVFAGDPPIDWSKVKSNEDLKPFLSNRDKHYGELVIREILDKKLNALLIMGNAHFFQNLYGSNDSRDYNIVKMIREKSPKSLYVINMIDNTKINEYPYPSILPITIDEIGNLPVSDINPYVKLADEIEAVLYLGPLTRITPTPFNQSSPYYSEYLRRKRIADTNPFKTEKESITDTKTTKKEIKKILFDIAALALENYNKKLKINKNTMYSAFIVPESFQNKKRGLYFYTIKKDSPDELILVGQCVKNWNEKIPKIQIKVAISKLDDFAIVEVKEF